MLWTLDQASGDLRRELLLASTCLNILRDERHARMHLRFRSDMGYGYLGQSHNHKPDALGITEATVAVVKRACTKTSNALLLYILSWHKVGNTVLHV